MTINNNLGYGATIASGLDAYRQGSETMARGSQEIAQQASYSNRENLDAKQQPVNLNQSVVNLVSGELQAKAGVKVIERADEMIGSIIDTFA